MSERYSTVSIGGVYLTSTGENTGVGNCVTITGLEALRLSQTGTSRPNADGTMITQLADLKGHLISISNEMIEKDVHEDVLAVFEQWIADGQSFELTIEGDLGTWVDGSALAVTPRFPKHHETSGEFIDGLLKNVTYFLQTA